MEKSHELLFLENVMIRENGLYVLFGSKPMCSFDIEDGFSESVQRSQYEKYMSKIQKETSGQSFLSFEEFRKKFSLPLRLHYRELWNRWNNKMNTSISPCYKFVSRKAPFDHESDFGLFINIPNTIYILKENYESFAQITGQVFDPLNILNEISNNQSQFWEKTFQNHYLMGLLFGFGKRNSFFFDWGAKHSFSYSQIIPEQQLNANKSKVSCLDLKLPFFGVYSINDDYIENYKRERVQIIKKFKRKDFMKTTLEQLCLQISQKQN